MTSIIFLTKVSQYLACVRVLLTVLLLSPVFCFSQLEEQNWKKELRPTNALYLDLYGAGSVFSLNYEKAFLSRRFYFLTLRGGVGYTKTNGDPNIGESTTTYQPFSIKVKKTIDHTYDTNHGTFPLHLSFNLGEGLGYLELGGHVTFFTPSIDNIKSVYGPLFGFRIYPDNYEGLVMRVYFSPPLQGIRKYDWYFPFGFSIGYSG